MLYSIKTTNGFENLNKLISLQNQVKALKVQEKLGKQIFLEVMNKVLEPFTDNVTKLLRKRLERLKIQLKQLN